MVCSYQKKWTKKVRGRSERRLTGWTALGITLAFEQPWAEKIMEKPRVYLLDPEAGAKRADAPAFYMQEKDGTKRKVEIDWEKIEEIRAKERLESAKDSLVVVPSARLKKEVISSVPGLWPSQYLRDEIWPVP